MDGMFNIDEDWLEKALLEDEESSDSGEEKSSKTLDVGDDFDFSEFYEDEESSGDESGESSEETGIVYDEAGYDEILKLDSDVTTLAVEAKYPYVRISGFLIGDEITFMQKTLEEYKSSLGSKYSDDEMLDIVLNIKGSDYIATRLPLILDTFLSIFKAHRYDVSLARGPESESKVTSELMKAFIFT